MFTSAEIGIAVLRSCFVAFPDVAVIETLGELSIKSAKLIIINKVSDITLLLGFGQESGRSFELEGFPMDSGQALTSATKSILGAELWA